MIEKILSNLQSEADFFGGEPMGSLQKLYYCEGVKKAIEIVQEVAKDGGWIPCSERLPEERKEVLVWHSDQDMPCVAWYHPPTKAWYSNDFVTEDSKYIVAWCKLPAPYQKGE